MLRGRKVGVSHEILLDIKRRPIFAEKRSVAVAEGVPANASKFLLDSEIAAGFMDRDVELLSATLFSMVQTTPGKAPHSGQLARHPPARRIQSC